MRVVMNVPHMTSDDDAREVTETLAPIEGVRSVTADLAAQAVLVDYDDTVVNMERMKTALRNENYEVAGAELAH